MKKKAVDNQKPENINPAFGTIGSRGIYKNSLRLLDITKKEDIEFYESLANNRNLYEFKKGEIIVHPSGKVYMLVYFAELIKELKSLTDKYKSAEEASKIPPPDVIDSMSMPDGSLMELLTSPVGKIYNKP